MVYDLHIAALYQPLPFFPAPVVCTLGFAGSLPVFYSTVMQAVRSVLCTY